MREKQYNNVLTLAMSVISMCATVKDRVSGFDLSKHCFNAVIPLLSMK